MDQKSGEARAIRVSVVTILGNVVLTILKLAAGLVAHSGAMVSARRSGGATHPP